MAGWNHYGRFKEKPCRICGAYFKPTSGAQFYCSKECGFKPAKEGNSTEKQYERISGNWSRYLSRLIFSGGVKRSSLTKEMLFKVLEKQNYKCALSGISLTCDLTKGVKVNTNASVDQIIPKSGYTEDNIQFVCRALNSWRSDVSVPEFIWWCQKVSDKSRGL